MWKRWQSGCWLCWARSIRRGCASAIKIDREQASQSEPYELLELIGHKRGMLMRGGEIDTERASAMLLDEYRAGRLGRITLEFPPAD